VNARGMLLVHSCPPAVRPHLEWAVAGRLGVPVSLEWSPQPVEPGSLRASTGWHGRPGTAAALAAALRDWPALRVEVTEEPSDGNDGERYVMTPSLGVHRATMSANGDVLVQEDRLRVALGEARNAREVAAAVRTLVGGAWDDELEAYRQAGEGAPLRWLRAAG
jgi:hypothetical protein